MMPTITSGNITLLDLTDTKKVDVHITSNYPTTQIYDTNLGTFTPSWIPTDKNEALKLSATVYADSLDVTDGQKYGTTYEWFKDALDTQKLSTTKDLIINTNVLSTSIATMVTYYCRATYNKVSYVNQITFSLIATGKNGLDGQDGKNGQDGKDGTSVNIKGTAYAKSTPVTGTTLDLYSDANTSDDSKIKNSTIGDAYLVDGYLCVYNAAGNNFICTGKIQGQKGDKGDSSYLFVRYADDQYGTGMSSSSDGKTYIGFYRSSVDVAPTNPSTIAWTKFVGTSASLVNITPSALYFKSTEGKNGTFTPEYIYLYPRFQSVVYDKWQYSTDGGLNWSNVVSDKNGLTINTYNSVSNTLRISRESTLYTDTITSISFRCLSSTNTVYDTVSIAKIYDIVDLKIGGRNLARYTDSENWISHTTSIVSFSEGTRSKRVKAVCNTTDTSTSAIFGIQQKDASRSMKLKSGQKYTLSFLVRGNVTNFNGSSIINPGAVNQQIESFEVPNISETEFIKVSHTFDARSDIDSSTGSYIAICCKGAKDTSKWFEIEEVQLEAGQVATDWSIAPEDILDSAANVNVMLSNEAHFFEADSSGVPTETNVVLDVVGFKGSIQSPTTIGEISGLPSAGMTATVSRNETTNTQITINTTKALTSSVADSGALTIPITVNGHTINKMFSWSKAKAGATGAAGKAGSDAYTVILTNEAHTFVGDVSNAVAGSTTTQVLAYKGSTSQSVTIVSVNGKTASTTDTDTGITGLKFKCSALTGTTPTITFTCTTSFVSPNGSIPIVISVGGVTFTKMFTYAIAFKGATGATGSTGQAGAPATAYWLVSSASVVQKTSTGTIVTNPSTLTFTGKSQTGTGTPTNYACRWIIASSNDGTTYIDVYTSAANESSISINVATTHKAIRVRMYMAGGTTTLLDEQIIPVVSDGVKGDTGASGRGVSSIIEEYYQSTSATAQSGGTWSTTVPTWVDGKYIWTRSVITYTDSNTSTTSPICITGQKGATGGTGASGVGVSSIDVWYYQSSSATSLSGGSWVTTAPTWVDGKYIWTKTITTYTNSTTDETNAVCITGQKGEKGDAGRGISTVTEYYLATSSSSGVTTSTSGWTTAIQTITADKKYLWNYELITYTDGNTSTTTPVIIGVFGNTGATGSTGATGKGIKSVTEYYLATTSSSGVTTSTTGWTTTMQTLTATNKYLWNYELITYTDDSKATINPVIIGVYGDKGDKGNQGDRGAGINSVTVTYGTSTSASTQPTSWQSTIPTVAEGSYLWTRTVTDYTDDAIADTVTLTYAKQGAKGSTGSAGTSVTVSKIEYQAGTSATTTPTGTWSSSVVSVAEGGYLWTKTTFSDGKVAYGVAKQGAKGTDAVTFQVYAPNGYLLTKDLSEITLQTFAYEGSTAITSGATYQWAQYTEDAWENISGATTSSLVVTKDTVVKSKSYKCTMTYKSKQYTDTATVQDKTDIYSSLIQTAAKYSSTNKYYWVLYSMVYSDEGERDKLLGPINTVAPDNPTSGQYWYKIDETNYTVTLMKYSGTTWATTTDKQELVYDWSLINDADIPISLGVQSKVKIVTASDFNKTCSVQCNIRGSESVPIAYSNQILIDPSDPIISLEEPINPTPGQLWIKASTNGFYTLLVWDASLEKWVTSEADSRVKVHISKPSSYEVGDVWVVGSDYEPTIYINGIAQTTKHLAGTMLKAQYSSQSYKDSDWVEALNYKKEIDNIKDNLNTYNQFFDFDEDGLTMQAKNQSGVVSEFKTKLTNTELGFYQGENKVAHINNNQLNISKAEITNGMAITGNGNVLPVLEIGNFTIMQESNGSLSIGLKI